MAFPLGFVLVAVACSAGSAGSSDAGALDGHVQNFREDAGEIPCEPRRVLGEICQQCHTEPTRNGAPFPLVRRSDIVAASGGIVVRELMIQQLEAGRMPLTPVTIPDGDRALLLAWLRAGAPAGPSATCSAAADAAADAPADGDAEASALDAADGGGIPNEDGSSDGAPE